MVVRGAQPLVAELSRLDRSELVGGSYATTGISSVAVKFATAVTAVGVPLARLAGVNVRASSVVARIRSPRGPRTSNSPGLASKSSAISPLRRSDSPCTRNTGK